MKPEPPYVTNSGLRQFPVESATPKTPLQFMARISELVRGGHSSTSIPQGSRSAEKPHPQLDAFDLAAIAARDGYRRVYDLVRADAAAIRAGEQVNLRVLTENVRKLGAWERWALCPMGVDGTHDPDPKAAAKAMAKAREKAIKEMAGTVDKSDRFECRNCHQWFKRTKNQRPKSGRCNACFTYWDASGRRKDAPQPVIDRRIEREMLR